MPQSPLPVTPAARRAVRTVAYDAVVTQQALGVAEWMMAGALSLLLFLLDFRMVVLELCDEFLLVPRATDTEKDKAQLALLAVQCTVLSKIGRNARRFLAFPHAGSP